jgi:hypothetical protein
MSDYVMKKLTDYVNYMDIKKFKCESPLHAYVSCYRTMNFHNFIKHSVAPHKESGLAKQTSMAQKLLSYREGDAFMHVSF